MVAPPTYNIVDELKAEGDWEVLQKYSGFEFDDNAPNVTVEASELLSQTIRASIERIFDRNIRIL